MQRGRSGLTGIASSQGVGAIESGRRSNPGVIGSIALGCRLACHDEGGRLLPAKLCLLRRQAWRMPRVACLWIEEGRRAATNV